VKAAPSVHQHPLFAALAPHLRFERCAKDGFARARRRIEVVTRGMSESLLEQLSKATCKCCDCGRRIRFFRVRRTWGTAYVAVACPLSRTFACARGLQARDAYLSIEAAAQEHRTTDGDGPLFATQGRAQG
jgi:hypothetical protein